MPIDMAAQFFPLYLYDDARKTDTARSLPRPAESEAVPSAATPSPTTALAHFRDAYPGEAITKEDLFYYVYGLLHSPDYRARFADNLGKELPRIPRVKTAADFWAFSKAGRALGELHINYEKVADLRRCEGRRTRGNDARLSRREDALRARPRADKDRTTLHYNDTITVTGIPLDAYDYVVNGKPALDWVVERQCVKTDKDSGIVNDANDWADRDDEEPQVPAGAVLARHHRQPGDDEDREGAAGA